jgi:hypothetical protein
MREAVLAFAQRGGLVIADSYLGLDVPGAIRVDLDFAYRAKVNADAIASGSMFAEWDDHLNPQTAALAEAKGVSAEDDQRILESYARRLREQLADKLEPAVALDTPKALVNVLEQGGVRYLVLINDNRTYDERTGQYKAIMEKLLPQTVTVTLRGGVGPVFAYDLLERRPLAVEQSAAGPSLKVDLGTLGGKIVALYPAELAKLGVAAPAELARGSAYALDVSVTVADGRLAPGLQPVQVTVTDPQGRGTEYSGYYCAEGGRLSVPFTPALNDEPGTWRVAVTDLTAGLTAEATATVR